MSAPQRPRIALTMGDPAGVGPEIICRACADAAIQDLCQPVVYGQRAVFTQVAQQLGLALPQDIIECGTPVTALRPGRVQAQCGAAAYAAVVAACDACLDGRAAAMVTAPLHKEALHAAGVPFPGHTEILAERCGGVEPVMLLYDEALSVALVTCHQSLRSVPDALTTRRIVFTAQHLFRALTRLHGPQARLAVLGLNPHAGEHGLFGQEDEQIIAPAVAELRAQGLAVDGPLPPDTAFTPAARQRYRGWVGMYHDQVLIPFKALAFAEGVNVSLGLPIVRTSVDHGTAFDIAWQGKADHHSLIAAIRVAVQLLASRAA